MLVKVLGSAAGGGFPQWNCGCANCDGVRKGTIKATARTQESVAISKDGRAWFLLNASPEIRAQIEGFTGLHPRSARHTPIQGIVLTSGDLDHCLGLLSLRESQPLTVYSTERMWRGFTEGNVLFRTLQRSDDQLRHVALRVGSDQPLELSSGRDSGLVMRVYAVAGKAPLHHPGVGYEPEDNIGLVISEQGSSKSLGYLSGVGGPSPALFEALDGADVVFFDGTFWSSDELVELGAGERRAEDMAHWPLGGEKGSLNLLRELKAQRRILIHINNSNPVLRDDSPERALVHQSGVELAYDGMELSL